jgi:hypothetical protein
MDDEPFTPIVKLIFAGEVIDNEKSLVMRCASILRLAQSKNIEPDGIGEFVAKLGGMVKCYKLDREENPPTTSNKGKPDPINQLRHNAQKCDVQRLRQLMPDGPVTALFDLDNHGNVLLLGIRTASPSDIKRFERTTKTPPTTENAIVDAAEVPLAASGQTAHSGSLVT